MDEEDAADMLANTPDRLDVFMKSVSHGDVVGAAQQAREMTQVPVSDLFTTMLAAAALVFAISYLVKQLRLSARTAGDIVNENRHPADSAEDRRTP